MTDLDFGYSPCPNDTYMFWAWAHGLLDRSPRITPRYADIQQLNQMALGPTPWSLTKTSVAAYFHPLVQERYQLLGSGAALGRGCGPLVVSQVGRDHRAGGSRWRLAHPGRHTTAAALCQMALGDRVDEWIELRYDQIMPAVARGEVDAGVIIHESRFVYPRHGLECVFDLGRWWEDKTQLPLPLGVMLARRDLGQDVLAQVEASLRDSIEMANQAVSDPQSPLWTYMRSNAIELEDSTIKSHVELYVNEYSLDLGEVGQRSVAEFGRSLSRVRAKAGI